MKKILVSVLLIVLICLMSACSSSSDILSRYTIEMGKKVFLSEDTGLQNNITSINVPDGYHFAKPVNNDVYIACTIEETTVTDQSGNDAIEEIRKYGLFSFSGDIIVACKYDSMFNSGNFFYAEYFDDDIVYKNDVFYIDGTMILTTDAVIELIAIDDDYCSLYYDDYSQVFDKDGVYYFKDGNKMSMNIRYSMCDGYLFGFDSVIGDWFIWQPVVNKSGSVAYGYVVLKKIFSSSNTVYSVAYLGDYDYLVIQTAQNASDYDYYEEINEETYYLKQFTSIYNVKTDTESKVKLEFPILAITNHYSPTLSLEQKQILNINKGYSQVSVGVVNSSGERTGYRSYVMDSNCNFVIRYPEKLNPNAIKFVDGYGVAQATGVEYAAALYYMNCDIIWQKSDREYYAQTFSDGRFVLSCALSNGIRYGVLDSDGEILVDFTYSYISPFVNGYAFFRKTDGSTGVMDVDCKEVRAIDDFYKESTVTMFGVYEFGTAEKHGLKFFDGNVVAPDKYDTLSFIGKVQGKLLVVYAYGDSEVIYWVG